MKASRFLILTAFSLLAQNGGEQPGAVRQEIHGTVLESSINQPIAGAEITILFQEREVGKVTTDSRGDFRFPVGKLGDYILLGKKDGYGRLRVPPFRANPELRVRVTVSADRPNREITFFMARHGQVSGRVVDADTGDPLPNFPIMVTQLYYRDGAARMFPVDSGSGNVMTDSEGRFRTGGLDPGLYVAVVWPKASVPDHFGLPPLLKEFSEEDIQAVDEDYPMTYWPGGAGLDVASGVSVPPGGFGDVGTIKVRKTTMYRVRVSAPTGCSSGDNVVMTRVWLDMVTLSQRIDCGQDVLIKNVPPGSYSFSLSVDQGRLNGILAFDVKDKNLDVTTSLHSGAALEGQVILADGARALPLDTLQVIIRGAGEFATVNYATVTKLDEKGKFRFTNRFAPSRLDVIGLDKTYYVKEIRYNGQPLSGIIFTPTASGPLQIVIDDKAAALTGVVADGENRVSEPYIVLSPWPRPADYFYVPPKNATGGRDGKFQFAGLAPGDYRIFAVSQTDRDKLDEPGVLGRLLAAGEKISLVPALRKTWS